MELYWGTNHWQYSQFCKFTLVMTRILCNSWCINITLNLFLWAYYLFLCYLFCYLIFSSLYRILALSWGQWWECSFHVCKIFWELYITSVSLGNLSCFSYLILNRHIYSCNFIFKPIPSSSPGKCHFLSSDFRKSCFFCIIT